MPAGIIRFALCVVVLIAACSGCSGLGTAVSNKWAEETERLHTNVTVTPVMSGSWADMDRAWRYLSEGRCWDAYMVTEKIWGRELYGIFEDVTILRLRSLACLGRYEDIPPLLDWMGVMFPWRAEEVGAAKAFVQWVRGDCDAEGAIWEGVRKYPEGWLYRLLGAQLLIRDGRIRDGMEHLNLLLAQMDREQGRRCGYDVVGHVERMAAKEMGRVGVESYWRPVGAAEGVVLVNGVYGVFMDYCHGQDPYEVGGWLHTVMSELLKSRRGTCGELLSRKLYKDVYEQCLKDVDYQHDDPLVLLRTGEVALRLGLTGKAQTAAYALLKRQERMDEAKLLLERVNMVLGRQRF